jgi:hypothetical protein
MEREAVTVMQQHDNQEHARSHHAIHRTSLTWHVGSVEQNELAPNVTGSLAASVGTVAPWREILDESAL